MINTVNIELTYQELLDTPEWKAKRLEILTRDNYTCKFCGSHDNLHCHHMLYINGTKPWEYPNEIFKTLCDTCHTKFHDEHSPTWMYRISHLLQKKDDEDSVL